MHVCVCESVHVCASARMCVCWILPFHVLRTSSTIRALPHTLLQDWLCIPPLAVDYILGAQYPRIDNLIIDPCTETADFDAVVLLGHHPSHTVSGEITIKFGLLQAGLIRLSIMDTSGQLLAELFHTEHAAGSHTFSLSPSDYLLSGGNYIYKLEAQGKEYLQKLNTRSKI